VQSYIVSYTFLETMNTTEHIYKPHPFIYMYI